MVDSDDTAPSPPALTRHHRRWPVWAMDQQEALLVEQPGKVDDSMESTVVNQAPGSAICVPIPQRKSCRGAIEVLRNNLVESLKQSNLELCIAVARQTGLALENLEHRERLEQANVQLRSEVSGTNRMIGESPAIAQLLELVGRVAPTESTVLVSGESGTGKELVARMIHDSSLRSTRPLRRRELRRVQRSVARKRTLRPRKKAHSLEQ